MSTEPPPRALHPTASLPPGGWYACQETRDPVPDLTGFDPRCPLCNGMLELIQARSPGQVVMTDRTATGLTLPIKSTAAGRLRAAGENRRDQ
jgi:hypothetical protein